MNIFSSIKILDLTRVFSGPFATRHFADYGATVIKVEPPQGDDTRNFPPLIGDWSGYFEVLNRNKKSVVLNLKNEEDLENFYLLTKQCDVIVENFTSNVTKKLKIDYATVKKINPKIIYASISGISDSINKKYYDAIAQAESGLISLNGEKQDMKISTAIIDAFSGMKLAYAISSALYDRESTKQGCKINVSMKGSAFDLLEQNLIESSVTKENPPKVGNMDNAIAPFGVFRTRDSGIVIAIGNEKQWKIFEKFLQEKNRKYVGDNYISNDSRLQNIKKLKKDIERVFRRIKSKPLIKIMNRMKIPCGQVNSMLDVIKDRENYQENLLEKVKHPIAGNIIVPTGGIFFSNHKKAKYKPAPKLGKSKTQ
jgi:CoA:oxalate CoA-transferase